MVTLLKCCGAGLAAFVVIPLALAAADAGALPAVDTSFGGGVITPKVFPKGRWPQVARGTAIQNDGKVLVPMALSVKYGRSSERPVLRYNANGKIDRSYGDHGAKWFGIAGRKFVGFSGIKLRPDGKALVYGASANNRTTLSEFIVARLTRSGKLDRGFGRQGVTRLSVGRNDSRRLLGVYPLADGRTIAAFQQDGANDSSLDLVRLKTDGRVDRRYADHGIKSIDVAHGRPDAGFADLAIAGDDAFVLINPDQESTGGPCKLIRTAITSGGGRVKSFGKNGTVTIATFKASDSLNCQKLTPTRDGGVAVVATIGFDESYETSATLAYKFRADGSRDPTFGVGGKVQGPDQEDLAGISELADGSLLAIGTRHDSDGRPTPEGGAAVLLDRSGGLWDLLPGRVLPGTGASFLSDVDHGAAGTLAHYVRYKGSEQVGSRIVKLTN